MDPLKTSNLFNCSVRGRTFFKHKHESLVCFFSTGGSMKKTLKAPKSLLGLLSLVALVGCGQHRGGFESDQTDASIIGGKAVVAGSAVATQTVGLYDASIGATCSASILSNQFLLTAAHCVASSKAADLIVIFGPEISMKGSKLRKVSGFKFNSKWLNAGSSAVLKDLGDIAIVKFEGGLPAGYHAARLLSDVSLLKDNTDVLLAGYGHSDGIKKTGSGILRRVIIKIENAAFSPTEVLLDQTKGKGACQGDSGGPAYVLEKDGKLSLFGITSRGEDDALDTCGVKSVYTNALAYKSWMKAAITALNTPKKSALVTSNALEDTAAVASLN